MDRNREDEVSAASVIVEHEQMRRMRRIVRSSYWAEIVTTAIRSTKARYKT